MPPPVKTEKPVPSRATGDPASPGGPDPAGSSLPSGTEAGLEKALGEIRQELRGVRKEMGILKKQVKRNAGFQEIRDSAREQADRLAAKQDEQIDRLQQLHQRLEGLERRMEEAPGKGGDRMEEIGRELRSAATRAAQENTEIGNQVREIREELIRQGQVLTLLKGETDRNALVFKEVREQAQALLGQLREHGDRVERQAAQDREEQARLRNNQGVVLYYRGAFEAAGKMFQEAVQLKPDYSEAYNNLGLTLSRMQRSEDAIQAFRRAIELEPGMAEVYNNLGFHFHSEMKFDQAIEMFRQALHRQEGFSEAYSNLGNTLYQLKQHDRALGAWKRALEIDPMNQNAQRSLRMFDQEGGGNGHPDPPPDAAGNAPGG